MSTQDDNSGISLDSDPQDKQHHLDDYSVTLCDHREQRQHDDDDDTDASDVISAKGKEVVQSQKGMQAYMSTYAANTGLPRQQWLCRQLGGQHCVCNAFESNVHALAFTMSLL
jgi:hypothetical protein